MKMAIKIFNYTLIAVILILFLVKEFKESNCNADYGPELNSKRKYLKIPLIPGDWVLRDKDDHYVRWVKSKGGYGHRSKSIVYDNCRIKREIDLYMLKPKNGLEISIERTSFFSSNSMVDSTTVYFQQGYSARKISLKQADSILKVNNLDSY